MAVVHWRDCITGYEGHGMNISRSVAEQFVASMREERRWGRSEPHMHYWVEEDPREQPEE